MEPSRRRASHDDLVSVVIPFHANVLPLRGAIHSVLGQTHPNVEILVVYDEPATDVSSAIPDALPPGREIRTFCQHRRGAGMARNFALEAARGEYVAFLDSDDLFLPTKIERQLGLMIEHDAAVSHTSYFAHGLERRMESGFQNSGRMSGYLIPRLIGYNPIGMSTAMLRRDCFERHRFPDAPLCEDYLFWVRLALEQPILGIEEPLSVITVSPDSVAYDPEKQATALRRIIAALGEDERLRRFGEQIDRLRELAAGCEAEFRAR